MDAFSITWMGIFCSLLVFIFLLIYLGQSSRKWPSTAGKLLEFKAEQVRFVSIKVKYEYVVNGEKYIGKRISFINPFFSTLEELKSDEFCSRIQREDFNVFYHRKYPKISTLKRGYNGWDATILVILMLLFGVFELIKNNHL